MPAADVFFDDEEYLRTVLAEKPPGSPRPRRGGGSARRLPAGRADPRRGMRQRTPCRPARTCGLRGGRLDGLPAAARRGAASRPRRSRGRVSCAVRMRRCRSSRGASMRCCAWAPHSATVCEDGRPRGAAGVPARARAGRALVIETLHRAEIGARLREHEERRAGVGRCSAIRTPLRSRTWRDARDAATGGQHGRRFAPQYELRVYSEPSWPHAGGGGFPSSDATRHSPAGEAVRPHAACAGGGGDQPGARAAQLSASRSIFAAMMKSLRLRPEAVCVHVRNAARPHSSSISGWWLSASASRATRRQARTHR